jgi:hypothetical protein
VLLLSAEVAAIAEIAAAGVQAEKLVHCHPAVARLTGAGPGWSAIERRQSRFALRVTFLSVSLPREKLFL